MMTTLLVFRNAFKIRVIELVHNMTLVEQIQRFIKTVTVFLD